MRKIHHTYKYYQNKKTGEKYGMGSRSYVKYKRTLRGKKAVQNGYNYSSGRTSHYV